MWYIANMAKVSMLSFTQPLKFHCSFSQEFVICFLLNWKVHINLKIHSFHCPMLTPENKTSSFMLLMHRLSPFLFLSSHSILSLSSHDYWCLLVILPWMWTIYQLCFYSEILNHIDRYKRFLKLNISKKFQYS